MKKLIVTLVAGAALCTVGAAQDSPAASPNQSTPQTNQAPTAAQPTTTSQAATTPKIAPGSVIPAQLTKTVDAKKAKAGDPVEATVTQDMKTNTGAVLIPKDTILIGKVTEALARSKEQKQSELSIAFDRAGTKDGNSMNLPMSIQAIVGRPNPTQNQEGTGAPGGNDTSAGVAPRGMAGGSSSSPGMPRSAAPRDLPTPPTGGSQASQATPNITASTTGVVGINDLTLSPPNGAEGSVVTSEKNNVKLESGTLLLLKVSQ